MPTDRGLHIAVSGLLLPAVYIGGVFVAISLGMPAGVTSLIVGTQPVLTAIFAQALLKARVAARQWLGLLLGLLGVSLVIGEKLVTSSGAVHAITAAGLLAAVLALFGTTFGTLYQRQFCAGMSLTK